MRVNDRMVRLAIRDGACTRESVADACGAGSVCGGCRPVVDALIEDEHRAEHGPHDIAAE
jgi:bacterioferritin-associated ferredoxin